MQEDFESYLLTKTSRTVSINLHQTPFLSLASATSNSYLSFGAVVFGILKIGIFAVFVHNAVDVGAWIPNSIFVI